MNLKQLLVGSVVGVSAAVGFSSNVNAQDITPEKPAATANAKESIDDKVDADDSVSSLHRKLADMYFDQGKYEEASVEYQKSSDATKKGNADALYRSALSMVLSGDTSDKVETRIDKAIEMDSEKAQAYRVKNIIYTLKVINLKKKGDRLSEEDKSLIEEYAKKARDADSKFNSLTVGIDTKLMLVTGDKLFNNGHYEQAKEMYDDAIEGSPNWAIPYNRLAMCKIKVGEIDNELVGYLEKSKEKDPLDMNTWRILGAVYHQLGKQDKALTNLRTVQNLFPDNKELTSTIKKIENYKQTE